MSNFSRLTNTFLPNKYNLKLNLLREDRTFSGTVVIDGNLSTDGEIPLHAKHLNITKATVGESESNVSYHDNDEIHLSNDQNLTGDITVTIKFDGKITDPMHGLYPCYYEIDGEKKELLATQFESHHAREVFPCVDEPEGKAIFDVELETETGIDVIGNMPVIDQTTSNGRLTTIFDTTPKMSPYLLAFVTGDLQKKSAKTKDGVEVNVWSTKLHDPESLDHALNTGIEVLEFYSDYFETPYPLPKCDHIALPDFASGAMENWGLVTYREVAMLAGKQSSINAKRYAAMVIAHETSHQWFGNLVTMKWWNDLWLNESFANMMEYLSLDKLHPDWNLWREYSATEAVISLKRDSLDGVQAVHVDVNHPDEISTLFDPAIVYAKGSRLMRMMQYYVGDKAFQDGLKTYFKTYKYQNTIGQNLWDELSKSSGKDISHLMNSWVEQSGYPVVTVSRDGDYVELSQEQFFIGPHDESDKTWPIPLDSNADYLPDIFEETQQKFKATSEEVLRLNVRDSANFIINYKGNLRTDIIKSIKDGKLDDISRLQFINHQVLLAKAGLIEYGDLVDLFAAYKNETSEHVWGLLGLVLAELRKMVENDESSESKLKTIVYNLAVKQYERLGWQTKNDETEEDTNLRSTIISFILYSENNEAIDKAHGIFTNSNLESIDPELRSLVISNEIKHYNKDDKTSAELIKVYGSTPNIDLRDDVRAGLTSTRSLSVARSLLESLTDTSIIRTQDTSHWFAYLMRNKYTRDLTWRWLRDNWQWIDDNFHGDKSIDYFPRYSSSSLRTEEHLEEYTAFFQPMKDDLALARAIAIGEKEIKGTIEQINRGRDSVIKALDNIDY